VIGFDDYRGATAQSLADQRRNVAKVHQGRDLYALVRRGKAKIVHGIMRDGERMKVDLADAKVAARFYLFDPVLKRASAFAWFFIVNVGAFTDVSLAGFGGNVDRAIDCPKQHAQSAGVVSVLVCNQDGVEFLYVFADDREPAREFFRAQSGVDENTSFARNDQNRIAR
jgi:hypothetical protein